MPAEVTHWFILLLLWKKKKKKPYNNIYQDQIKIILISVVTGTVTFAGKVIRVLYRLFLQLLYLSWNRRKLSKGKKKKKGSAWKEFSWSSCYLAHEVYFPTLVAQSAFLGQVENTQQHHRGFYRLILVYHQYWGWVLPWLLKYQYMVQTSYQWTANFDASHMCTSLTNACI